VHDVLPHEAEPVLSRRAEQVQLDVVVDGDAPEVEGDRGRRLRRHVAGAVDLRAGRGHHRLGAQRLDLGDGTDRCRLADTETAGDDDLYWGGRPLSGRLLSGLLRVHE
jgi:hypothetical protein